MKRAMIFSLLLSASLFSFSAEERFDMEVKADSATKVYVKHAHGSLFIQGWDRDEVVVKGVKRGTGRMAKQLDRVWATLEKRGNTVEVIGHRESRNWSWKNWGNLSMDLEVFMPRDLALQFRHAHGSSEVSQIDGDVEASQRHGRFDGNDFGGDVNLDNAHGKVNVAGIMGNLILDNSHGRARLTNVRGSADIETSHGSVTLDGVEGSVEARGSHAGISILPSGPITEDYTVRVNHGNIRIDVPESSDARLEMRARHGNIHTDLPAKRKGQSNRKQAWVELNSGRAMISLETSHGSIRVNQI